MTAHTFSHSCADILCVSSLGRSIFVTLLCLPVIWLWTCERTRCHFCRQAFFVLSDLPSVSRVSGLLLRLLCVQKAFSLWTEVFYHLFDFQTKEHPFSMKFDSRVRTWLKSVKAEETDIFLSLFQTFKLHISLSSSGTSLWVLLLNCFCFPLSFQEALKISIIHLNMRSAWFTEKSHCRRLEALLPHDWNLTQTSHFTLYHLLISSLHHFN